MVEAKLHGQPVTTWHVTDLTKLVTPPWTPINILILVEIKTTHSTYSSPLLKVRFSSSSTDETLLGVESRVEHLLDIRK
jgi:hypothetical protein